METEIELTVTCEGKYLKGFPSAFNADLGNWLPEQQEDIRDFKVSLSRITTQPDGRRKAEQLDITKWLTEAEYDMLFERFIEHHREEH